MRLVPINQVKRKRGRPKGQSEACQAVSIRLASERTGIPLHVLERRNNARFEDDAECRWMVRTNPAGVSRAEIAEWFGVSDDRVRQIEEGALRKLLSTSATGTILKGLRDARSEIDAMRRAV